MLIINHYCYLHHRRSPPSSKHSRGALVVVSRFHFLLLIRKEPDTFYTFHLTGWPQSSSSFLEPTQIFSKCTQLCQVIPKHTSSNTVGMTLNIDWISILNLQTDLWFLHKIIPTLFTLLLFTWECPLVGWQKWNLSLKIHKKSHFSCHITTAITLLAPE